MEKPRDVRTKLEMRLGKLEKKVEELISLLKPENFKYHRPVNRSELKDLEKELLAATTIKVFQGGGQAKVVPLVTVFEDFLKSYAVKPVEVPEHFEFREAGDWGMGY